MNHIVLTCLIGFTTAMSAGCYTQMGGTEGPITEHTEPKASPADTASTADILQPKDPQLAQVLSFLIPGGGQFYAEKAGKGFLILGASTAAILIATNLATEDEPCSGLNCSGGELVDADQVYTGIAMSSLFWLYGIFTADDDVREWNQHLRDSNRMQITFITDPISRKPHAALTYTISF